MAVAQAKSQRVNRREFLYYAGGASIALLAAETCAAITWFVTPHVSYGVKSGVFLLDVKEFPFANRNPEYAPDYKSWLSNTENGLIALYSHCPLDDLIIKWVSVNNRFECPGCGSKFRIDGTYIEGPSERSLDTYPLQVTTANGTISTPSEGGAVDATGAYRIVLDAREVILGKPRLIEDTR